MAKTKKQEVVLLHGNSPFTKDKIELTGLVQGELVIEHGKISVDNKDEAVTKIHTIDNTGAELATFIDEKAIDKKIADGTSTLKSNVANLQEEVSGHTTDISDLKAALGMGGTGDTTSVTVRVKALEDTVGDETDGLVKDVKDLKSDLNDETDGIKVRLEAVEVKATDNAADIATLDKTVNGEGEDTGLVGKVAANEEAIEINADEIAKLKEYVVDGYTPEGEGAEKVNGLLDRVTALENTIGDADAEGSIVDQLTEAKSDIAALETIVGDADKGLVKDVADLQKTVGNAESGIVKVVNEHTTKINKLEGAVGAPSVPGEDDVEGTPATGLFADVEANTAKINTNTAAIETLRKQIGTDITTELGKLDVPAEEGDKAVQKYVSYVEQTDGKISAHYETLDAQNVKATYPKTGGTETTVQAALDDLNATDLLLGGQIEAVDKRIDTILGSDKAVGDNVVQKTIRQIANEELAAQLLAGPDGVVDNFKTLRELAAWLEQHPEDAAAMNEDIANLKTALAGYIVTGEDGTVTVTDVKGVIDALAKRLDDEDTELNKAITALTQTVATNKATIDAYTVNGKAIFGNPVLVSTDINMTAVVGNTTATTQTIQTAIEQVEADITAAKTDVIAELDTVKVTAGDGLDVKQTGREFTVSITKIDAGTYDDDGTPEA